MEYLVGGSWKSGGIACGQWNNFILYYRFAYNVFETGEHVGTHVDAPYHFKKDGWKLGDIPQERFFAPGMYWFMHWVYLLIIIS